jgi:ectoine hydroxylase-related dioxygenase (phytanoyl-CoA dioxygenase family)
VVDDVRKRGHDPTLTLYDRRVEAVTPDVIDAFRRDGAVCVRGAFSRAELALVESGIERNLAQPSARALVASGADDPGRFFEDFCNWTRIAEYEEFVRRSPAGEIAGALMGSRQVRLFHDHVLVKEPGTRQPTPWHQDQPYYNVEGFQTCSMWLPVDPVDRSSTLEFVAGSHRGPWLMPRAFMDNQAKWFPEGSLAELPDIDGNREAYDILAWELEPGDAVFFHMLTLHAAGGATRRRRAFSVRFLGDDVTHAPRPWKTSPDFPGLDDELPAGGPMDHPLFPVVWEDATAPAPA